MRHKKLYRRTGDGCDLWHGDTIIASSSLRSINWDIGSCPICGDYVRATGHCPDTDRVDEISLHLNTDVMLCGGIERTGYKSLREFYRILKRENRACKKRGIRAKFEITLPIKE